MQFKCSLEGGDKFFVPPTSKGGKKCIEIVTDDYSFTTEMSGASSFFMPTTW
jgi:hypothetical protein